MQVCKFCGHKNPDEIAICLSCASNLGRECPNCGAISPSSNRYCGQCGTILEQTEQVGIESTAAQPGMLSRQDKMLLDLREKIPASLKKKIDSSGTGLTGQRHEVTVVSVAINDFPSISQKLDNEELYLLVEEVMQHLVKVVYRFEGAVDNLSQDSLVAIFGIPLNHENDPERALRAGLEMQAAISELSDRSAQLKINLNLRIGVNTGQVITGGINNQYKMDYTVVGDTISHANRLSKIAAPGECRVSFRTYQRTLPIFDFQELPWIDIDHQQPVQTYRLLRIRTRPGNVRGLPGLQVPMVGRKAYLEKMLEVLNEVRAGSSTRQILIQGEAGLGKSRLVSEFTKSITGQSYKIYQGSCSSYMRITPYRIISNMIRNALRLSEIDRQEIQRAAIKDFLIRNHLESGDILPYLLYVLDLPQDDTLIESQLKLLSPTMLQHQVHSALRSFFIAESGSATLILVFDDLHWVDPASTEFLNYFIPSIEGLPILLVLIARDLQDQPDLQAFTQALQQPTEGLLVLGLAPLPLRETHLLVNQLIVDKSDSANRSKELIVARSAGNPYYVEELVRILMDFGGMAQVNNVWHVTEQAEKVLNSVPGTLQDIILARFDRLPGTLRTLAQKISVLGQSFTLNLLQALLNIDQGELVPYLEALEEREFLFRTQSGGNIGFRFKHPLVQEAIYHTLLKNDLRRFHLLAAEMIEKNEHLYPGERIEVLAHHYSESAAPEKAIRYLQTAAESALARYANQNAVSHYKRLFKIISKYSTLNLDWYGKVMIGYGKALKFTGEFQEAKNCLEKAIRLLTKSDGEIQHLSRLQELVEAYSELADLLTREGNLDEAMSLLQTGMEMLGGSNFELYPILWRRLADRAAWVNFRQGKLEDAFRLADLALLNVKLWEQEDPITLASLYNTLGGIYWVRTKYSDAIRSVERSLEIYRNLGYFWGMAIAYTNMGVLFFSQGIWSKAVENLERADSLRRVHGYTLERPTNLKNLGEVFICMGDFSHARETLELSLEISQRLGLNLAQIYAQIGLARLSILEENYPKAQAYLKDAKACMDPLDIEKDDRHIQILTLEARILAHSGDLSTALDCISRARLLANEAGLSTEEVDALRIMGMILTRQAKFEQAEQMLRDAAQLAIIQQDRYHQALSLLYLGKNDYAWYLTSDPPQYHLLIHAHQVFSQAIQLFEELGDRFDLLNAQKALQQLPSGKSQAAALQDSLNLDQSIGQAAIESSQGFETGQWYQVTLIYLKLFSLQTHDTDYLYETYALLIPSLVDIAHQNQGYVIKAQDALTILYGAPRTHEDDPERAIETAMQFINFIQEFNSQVQSPALLKMIVVQGKIVAGRIQLGFEESLVVTGDVVDQARSLIEAVPPVQVWATQLVKDATCHRFEYQPVLVGLGTKSLGRDLFQLIGLREQIRPVRGLIGIKTPFIGRLNELEAMFTIGKSLKAGLGGLIWIEGEAGIGKSRLMREFAQSLSERIPCQTLYGACTARRSERAFSLFSDLLFQLFEIPPTFSNEEIDHRIDQKLAQWSEELKNTRPFIQFLLGLQPEISSDEPILSLEPDQLRRQTFIQFRKLLNVLSDQKPLLLLMDDLQWIDSISADLLLFLSYLTTKQPILIIATQRSIETSASENVLEKIKAMHFESTLQLLIKPFSSEESMELLEELLSNANVPPEILSLIIQQSGGNPYYIEEFMRLLLEKKILHINRGRLQLRQNIEIGALDIPSSLEALLRTRVDSLPKNARSLIQSAAVIGHQFDQEQLETVSQISQIKPNLEILRNRGMLIFDKEAGSWSFSHPLIETTVYNSVLRAQRQALHARAARALENKWAERAAEHAEDLAYHYQKANNNEKAVTYLILAGERAVARFANEEALVLFEQANELLTSIPSPKVKERWQIAIGLGSVYLLIGNYDASVAALKTALELLAGAQLSNSQRAGLYRLLGETMQKKGDQEAALKDFTQALEVLGEPMEGQAQIEASRILTRIGWSNFYKGELLRAEEACLQALVWAQHAANPGALAMVENLLGGVAYRQGDFNQATLHAQQAMKHWDEIGYSWGVATSLGNLGILQVSAGNWPEAQNFLQQSLELYQKIGDVEAISRAHNNLGTLARDRGELDVAERHFRDSLVVAKPYQMAWQIANSTHGLAQSLLYKRQLAAAQETLNEGRLLASEIGAQNLLAEMRLTQAEILQAQHKLHQAIETSTEAAHMAVETENHVVEASAWRVQADCLLQMGEKERAKDALDKAWQSLVDSPDELETGRIHALAERVESTFGHRAQSRKHYLSAHEIFFRLGAQRDLQLLESTSQHEGSLIHGR